MKTILLIAALLMGGCAHQARHISPPDNSAVIGSAQHLSAAVAKAKTTAIAAQTAVAGVKEVSSKEGAVIQRDAVKLTALLRAAPPELREAITAVQNDNTELMAMHEDLQARIAEAARLQTAHAVQLGEEIPKAQAELAKANESYFSSVNALTDRANASETGWAKDAKALAWYRFHWFIGIIVLVAGCALCALVAFLKFTTKTAIAGSAFLK